MGVRKRFLTGTPRPPDNFVASDLPRLPLMVLALSRTRHFVHAVSIMATAVLYINPWLLHTFVETPAA